MGGNHYFCRRVRRGVMRAEVKSERSKATISQCVDRRGEATHSHDQTKTSEIIHSFQTLFLTLTLSLNFIIDMHKYENSRDYKKGNLNFQMK